VTLARTLSDRAWFQATCPDASFRSGQQAVKDAKAACSIMAWKDENMIDILAAAYAETGDFDSAVRYAQQALAFKDIATTDSKRIPATPGIISAAQANSLFVISPFALHRNTAQRALHCSDA
jgi:hypothetical protein